MDAAKVVVREEQRQRRFVVFPLLAVPVRESRKAANPHAEREVRPLDVRRADTGEYRVSRFNVSVDAKHHRRGVTRVRLDDVAVDLDDGAMVGPPAETSGNGLPVCGEGVCTDLEPAARRPCELTDERLRSFHVSPAQVPSDEQLTLSFKRREAEGVAATVAVVLAPPDLLFAAYETPYLVALHVLDLNLANDVLHHHLAPLTSGNGEAKDRVAVNAHDTIDRANLIAFKNQA